MNPRRAGRRMLAVITLALVAVPTAADADEAAVRRLMQQKLGASAVIESVQKTRFADLYEVVIQAPDGASIYYVDSRATVIIVLDAASPAK